MLLLGMTAGLSAGADVPAEKAFKEWVMANKRGQTVARRPKWVKRPPSETGQTVIAGTWRLDSP
jgi:hypothetical protein